MLKRIFALLCVCLLFSLTGCSTEKAEVTYNLNNRISSVESGIVAENTDYALSWNDTRKCVIYTDKKNGVSWSGIPNDYLNSGETFNRFLNSPLNVSVFNEGDKSVTNINGYSYAISSGRVGCEKVKNGIKVTYYFDKYGFSIPVTYTLNDICFDITIDPKEIIETDYKVVALDLAPNLCSVKNDSDSSYLFLPVGSGALMSCKSGMPDSRKYSGNVYGLDAARIMTDTWFSEKKINLPVFGAKNNNTALYGIIKSFAGSAIEAEAGNNDMGYSIVYPRFELRGYDVITSSNLDYTKYSDEMTTSEKIQVSYYMLCGSECEYFDMAAIYKEYLTDEYEMKKTDCTRGVLFSFYGGDLTKEFFLGIPYKKLSVATFFSDVMEITEDFIAETSVKPSLQLIGYSKTGISPGKPVGDFNVSEKFGDLTELIKWANASDLLLYFDFDLVRFNESSAKCSKLYGSAKTANSQRMSVSAYTIDVHAKKSNVEDYYLVRRGLLDEMANKLKNAAIDAGIGGISFNTISNTAYSDYSDVKYYGKGNITEQIADIIGSFSGLDTLVSAANDYAAATADAITDVEFSNGEYSCFSKKVPFYQMVFSGIKSMYSNPLDSASDYSDTLLNAVSTGTGISFSVIKNYDTDYSYTNDAILSKSIYFSNRANIIAAVKSLKNLYSALEDSALISYDDVGNGLVISVFDNGTIIYTNYSDNDMEYDGITVGARDFVLKGEDK